MGNLASLKATGATYLSVFYPLYFSRTRLAGDVSKGAKKEKVFYELVDCLKKVDANDGIGGLYKQFRISVVGIIA